MRNLSELHIEFMKTSKEPPTMLVINTADAPDLINQMREFGPEIVPDVPLWITPYLETQFRP